MTPQLATYAFVCGIVCLFYLVRDKTRTSPALWVPVIWLLIGGSRNVSEWLQFNAPRTDADRYLEGNPLDRNVLSGLMAIALVVLISRRKRLWELVRTNWQVCLYFVYCLASVLWSDHPEVAGKRWFRAMGDVVMVLVVLTDENWIVAFKRLFTRVGFILLPVSVLLIRYYPDLGRSYSRWTGRMFWTGVTVEKNSLGIICMIFGLAAVYHALQARWGPVETRQKGAFLGYGFVVLMAIWLLIAADSATSLACFFIGSAVMVFTTLPLASKKPKLVHILVMGILSLVCTALFVAGSGLLELVGRDSTLTGRTDIWQITIGMTVNPLLGAGYETFWLGDRLAAIWELYYNHPNQAHNGYLEIYLNLGWIGVILLSTILVKGYRNIILAVQQRTGAGSLRLAYFVTVVIYACTEAAFKMMHPAWVTLLVSVTQAPQAASVVEASPAAAERAVLPVPNALNWKMPQPAARSVTWAR